MSTRVTFLTVNDLYEIFPNDDGVGGIAQLATLLDQTRASLVNDNVKVIVTVNGDFLWRCSRDRLDKG